MYNTRHGHYIKNKSFILTRDEAERLDGLEYAISVLYDSSQSLYDSLPDGTRKRRYLIDIAKTFEGVSDEDADEIEAEITLQEILNILNNLQRWNKIGILDITCDEGNEFPSLLSPHYLNSEISQQMINWLTAHNIRHLPRQLDHSQERTDLNYASHQITWFESLYKSKSRAKEITMPTLSIDTHGQVDLADTGRACCGGRQICENSNYKDRKFYVSNKFSGWYCSVNHFFLYVKQVTGEIFVNKDCKMNFDGTVSPIGTLDRAAELIQKTQQQLETNTLPVIQCAKTRCYCGLCSPKSDSLDTYHSIMEKYQKKAS
jgi:hypothetical protein